MMDSVSGLSGALPSQDEASRLRSALQAALSQGVQVGSEVAAGGDVDLALGKCAALLLSVRSARAWSALLEAFESCSSLQQALGEVAHSRLLRLCAWLAHGGERPTALESAGDCCGSDPRCSRVWLDVHVAYRCRDCGTTESSCVCLDCFDPAEHEGHDFRIYRSSSGGCCDCGDTASWRPSGFCRRHRGASLASAASGDEAVAALDPRVRRGCELATRLLAYEVMLTLSDALYSEPVAVVGGAGGAHAARAAAASLCASAFGDFSRSCSPSPRASPPADSSPRAEAAVAALAAGAAAAAAAGALIAAAAGAAAAAAAATAATTTTTTTAAEAADAGGPGSGQPKSPGPGAAVIGHGPHSLLLTILGGAGTLVMGTDTEALQQLCEAKLARMGSFLAEGPRTLERAQTYFMLRRQTNCAKALAALAALARVSPAYRRLASEALAWRPLGGAGAGIDATSTLLVFSMFADLAVQEGADNLFLQLLVDEWFKREFTLVFVGRYRYLADNYLFGSRGVRSVIARSLDRVLCQLSNSREQVQLLVNGRPDDMLATIVGCVNRLIKLAARPRRFDYLELTDDADPNAAELFGLQGLVGGGQGGGGAGGLVDGDRGGAARVLRKLGPDGGFPPAASDAFLLCSAERNMVVDCTAPSIRERLVTRLVMDLRMLLRHAPVVLNVAPARPEVMAQVLELLALMQEMNLQVRRIDQHVLFEPPAEWGSALVLELDLSSALMRIVDGFALALRAASAAERPALTRGVLAQTTLALTKWLDGQGLHAARFASGLYTLDQEASAVALLVHHVSRPNYATSGHIPLHRFWAATLRAVLQSSERRTTIGECVRAAALPHLRQHLHPQLRRGEPHGGLLGSLIGAHLVPAAFPFFVAEHPLRVLVKVSQAISRMWVRNGSQVELEAQQYLDGRWSAIGRDLDIFTLQYAAAEMDGDTYIRMLVKRFELEDRLVYGPPGPGLAEREAAAMCFSMLRSVSKTVRDRTSLGETPHQILRKALVQVLASSPDARCSFSAIEGAVLGTLPETIAGLRIEQVLEEVADFVAPAGSGSEGVYKLKDSVWAEGGGVDLYHSHYTAKKQAVAEENFKMHYRKRKRAMAAGSTGAAAAAAADGKASPPPPPAAAAAAEASTGILDLLLVPIDGVIFQCFARMPFNVLWNHELHAHIFRIVHAACAGRGTSSGKSSSGDRDRGRGRSDALGAFDPALARVEVLVEALRLLLQAVGLVRGLDIHECYDAEAREFLQPRGSAERKQLAQGEEKHEYQHQEESNAAEPVNRRQRNNSRDGSIAWVWPVAELQQAHSAPHDMRVAFVSINHRVDALHNKVRLPFSNPVLNACEVVPFFLPEEPRASEPRVSSGAAKDWSFPAAAAAVASAAAAAPERNRAGSAGRGTRDSSPFPSPSPSPQPPPSLIEALQPRTASRDCVGISLLMLLLQLEYDQNHGDHVAALATRLVGDISDVIAPLTPGPRALSEAFRRAGDGAGVGAVARGAGSASVRSDDDARNKKSRTTTDSYDNEDKNSNNTVDAAALEGGGALFRVGTSSSSVAARNARDSAKKQRRQRSVLATFAARQREFSDHLADQLADVAAEVAAPAAAPLPPAQEPVSDALVCALCREGVSAGVMGHVAFAAPGSAERVLETACWHGHAQIGTGGSSRAHVLDALQKLRAAVAANVARSCNRSGAGAGVGAGTGTGTGVDLPPASLAKTLLFEGCGHCLHAECHRRYQSSLEDSITFSVARGEYRCPICRSMANTLVPCEPAQSAPPPEGAGPAQLAAQRGFQDAFFRLDVPALMASSGCAPPAAAGARPASLLRTQVSDLLADNFTMLLFHVNSDTQTRLPQSVVVARALSQAALWHIHARDDLAEPGLSGAKGSPEDMRRVINNSCWALTNGSREPGALAPQRVGAVTRSRGIFAVLFDVCLEAPEATWRQVFTEVGSFTGGIVMFTHALERVLSLRAVSPASDKAADRTNAAARLSTQTVDEATRWASDMAGASAAAPSAPHGGDVTMAHEADAREGAASSTMPPFDDLEAVVKRRVPDFRLDVGSHVDLYKTMLSLLEDMDLAPGFESLVPECLFAWRKPAALAPQDVQKAMAPLVQGLTLLLQLAYSPEVRQRQASVAGPIRFSPVKMFESADVQTIHLSLPASICRLLNFGGFVCVDRLRAALCRDVPGHKPSHDARTLAALAALPELRGIYPVTRPKLVALPALHTHLYLRFCGSRTGAVDREVLDLLCCLQCHRPLMPDTSMLCLLCGLVSCVREGCGKGAAHEVLVEHALQCSRAVFSGVCAFLPVCMSSAYVTIDRSRTLQYGPIYLDQHGEADPALQRGKPLFLSALRAEQLEEITLALHFINDPDALRRVPD
jgi:hypothetical protein